MERGRRCASAALRAAAMRRCSCCREAAAGEQLQPGGRPPHLPFGSRETGPSRQPEPVPPGRQGEPMQTATAAPCSPCGRILRALRLSDLKDRGPGPGPGPGREAAAARPGPPRCLNLASTGRKNGLHDWVAAVGSSRRGRSSRS